MANKKTAYALGYVYGIACRALPEILDTPGKAGNAQLAPTAGLADAINKLHQNHAMTGDIDKEIAQTLEDIDIDDLPETMSLELQGIWHLGYYGGKSGHNTLAPRRLRDMREDKGLSQMQLAAELDVSQQMIAQWETGKRSIADKHKAKLAEILDCSIDKLP